MNVNKELINFAEKNLKPRYESSGYAGHGWEHIENVINRSFDLIKEFKLDVNPDIVYIVAAYHDIGYEKDPENHERVSSEMFLNDKRIQEFFNDDDIMLIANAIEDHRASLKNKPRNIYGELVSSADRAIDVNDILKRSIKYQYEKHKSENPAMEDVINYSFEKLSKKYGNRGYAKMYYQDKKYKDYLKKIRKLLSDKGKFKEAETEIILNSPVLMQKLCVKPELKEYIEKHVFPEYSKNEPAHSIDHIKYVIKRSFELVKENNLDVNLDMVYTIAAYHDIGHHIDSENHEKISAEMMMKDNNLGRYFTQEEKKLMKEGIEDHRASSKTEPRSLYGKIVSSADRNNTVEACLKRTYIYGKKLAPNATDEELFLRAYDVLKQKFGENGYAKFYFKDTSYENFLKQIRNLLSNKEKYIKTQRDYIRKIKKERKI